MYTGFVIIHQGKIFVQSTKNGFDIPLYINDTNNYKQVDQWYNYDYVKGSKTKIVVYLADSVNYIGSNSRTGFILADLLLNREFDHKFKQWEKRRILRHARFN